MEPSSTRLKYLLLHFHLALSPAAMKHSLSIVSFAHKSATAAYYFFIAFCTSSPFYDISVLLATLGNTRNMCLFSCCNCCFFFRQPLRVCTLCKDTVNICVFFTFVVFNINCCLGLQQQRDQLLVTTQSRMVQRR